jgi:hypothetical protein
MSGPTVDPLRGPLWTVVNLDTLVKRGLAAAFVRPDERTAVAFGSQAAAEDFIRRAADREHCVSHLFETTREVEWWLSTLAREGVAYVRFHVESAGPKLLAISRFLTTPDQ